MQDNLFHGIHHASLLVQDLSFALGFYVDILGLPLDTSRPDMAFDGAWLALGGGQQIHLLVLPDPCADAVLPEHGGRDRHVALLVSDVEAVARRLEQNRVAFTRSGSGRAALFCRDPDGNALEFVGMP